MEDPEIRIIAEDVANPHSLVVDDDEEGKVYFFIGQDFHILEEDELDDVDNTRTVIPNAGTYKNLFFY